MCAPLYCLTPLDGRTFNVKMIRLSYSRNICLFHLNENKWFLPHINLSTFTYYVKRIFPYVTIQYAKRMFPLFRAIVKFCSTNRLFTYLHSFQILCSLLFTIERCRFWCIWPVRCIQSDNRNNQSIFNVSFMLTISTILEMVIR